MLGRPEQSDKHCSGDDGRDKKDDPSVWNCRFARNCHSRRMGTSRPFADFNVDSALQSIASGQIYDSASRPCSAIKVLCQATCNVGWDISHLFSGYSKDSNGRRINWIIWLAYQKELFTYSAFRYDALPRFAVFIAISHARDLCEEGQTSGASTLITQCFRVLDTHRVGSVAMWTNDL